MTTPVPEYLNRILDNVRDDDAGEVADHIEDLKSADPDKLGLAVCTATGHLYSVGDDDYEFSIQSISKPFVYALALEELGPETVHDSVGVEPSGEAFNELSLDEETRKPSNPMINAGAITVNQLINGSDSSVEERVEKIRVFLSRLAGRELRIDDQLVDHELGTAYRNLAIAFLLREFGMLSDEAHDAVNSYTQQCAVMVTVKDLAVMAATLANGGVQPVTGERVLSAQACRVTQAVMTSCGMYDGSGRWMVNVGIPAKSGVAGGLIGTMPGQLGIASLSPRLNKEGNSVRGVEIFRQLSKTLGLNLMSSDYYAAPGIKSVDRSRERTVVELQGMINFTAAEKIVHDLTEMDLQTEYLVLDVSHVTSFNKAGRMLIKEGFREFRDAGCEVKIYDPDGAMTDYEFSDGTSVEAIEDFSTSFEVPAPRERVYRAISNPKEWWDNAQISGSASEPGNAFELDEQEQHARFTVEEAADGDRLVWHAEPGEESADETSWSGTDIIFELEEGKGDETRVTLTHRGMLPHDERYEQMADGWRKRMDELKKRSEEE
ncbi:glutaminase [Corynebacterium timonense]|uniref:Glutaminase n=1 Tax=Corynebacterium timonense TaxID=441500 RepID=A0A1H1U1K5_9CORY|nr:glutaminase [Corynebacterium timonense]SDS66254.1 L-glutaminase [Corynebacterium timonense]